MCRSREAWPESLELDAEGAWDRLRVLFDVPPFRSASVPATDNVDLWMCKFQRISIFYHHSMHMLSVPYVLLPPPLI